MFPPFVVTANSERTTKKVQNHGSKAISMTTLGCFCGMEQMIDQ